MIINVLSSYEMPRVFVMTLFNTILDTPWQAQRHSRRSLEATYIMS